MGQSQSVGGIVRAAGAHGNQHRHGRMCDGLLRQHHRPIGERGASRRETLKKRAHRASALPAVGLNQPTVRLLARRHDAAARATASRVTAAMASHDR